MLLQKRHDKLVGAHEVRHGVRKVMQLVLEQRHLDEHGRDFDDAEERARHRLHHAQNLARVVQRDAVLAHHLEEPHESEQDFALGIDEFELELERELFGREGRRLFRLFRLFRFFRTRIRGGDTFIAASNEQLACARQRFEQQLLEVDAAQRPAAPGHGRRAAPALFDNRGVGTLCR